MPIQDLGASILAVLLYRVRTRIIAREHVYRLVIAMKAPFQALWSAQGDARNLAARIVVFLVFVRDREQ